MADHIQFKVSAVPVEELTDENGGTKKIIASEIGRSLRGGGNSVNLTDYSLSAATQGYSNGTVNYIQAPIGAGGAQIGSGVSYKFIYIKHTGHLYSNATTLGDTTTDCVLVALEASPYSVGLLGVYVGVSGSTISHYYEIGWLKPNTAMVLPVGAPVVTFGLTSNDLSSLNQGITGGYGTSYLRIRSYESTGGTNPNAAGIAVEILGVV